MRQLKIKVYRTGQLQHADWLDESTDQQIGFDKRELAVRIDYIRIYIIIYIYIYIYVFRNYIIEIHIFETS